MCKLVLLTQYLYIAPKLRPIKRYKFRTIPPFFNHRILKTPFIYIGVINDYYLHVRSKFLDSLKNKIVNSSHFLAIYILIISFWRKIHLRWLI